MEFILSLFQFDQTFFCQSSSTFVIDALSHRPQESTYPLSVRNILLDKGRVLDYHRLLFPKRSKWLPEVNFQYK